MAATVKANPFIVFDYETGGLDPNKNPITEVAAIALRGDNLEEIGRYEAYLKPHEDWVFESDLAPEEVSKCKNMLYTNKALEITGISREDLETNGLELDAFAIGLWQLMEKANEVSGRYYKPILVGHNVIFDIGFLQWLAKAVKKDLKKILHGDNDYYGNFQPAYIDTMFHGKMKFQGDPLVENFKLGTIIEKNGLELADAHRAMNDVIATKELFILNVNEQRNGSAEVQAGRLARVRNHWQF